MNDEITVAVPTEHSQGMCYHAAGGPCGSHLVRNITTTFGELHAAGLTPCQNCMEDHGLESPTG